MSTSYICSRKFNILCLPSQSYQQPAAYSYAAWPAQQPAYSAAQLYAAQPDDSNPPVPGTEMPSVNDSSAGQQQVSLVIFSLATYFGQDQPRLVLCYLNELLATYINQAVSCLQAHPPYSQDQAARDAQQQWYQYCHEYYQYYGQWPPQQEQQQQQQYNYTAPQPQASAAPWAPVSAPQQPVVLPAPSQQPAAAAHFPTAASYARPSTRCFLSTCDDLWGMFCDSSLYDGQQYMQFQQGCVCLIGWLVLNAYFACMQSDEGSGSSPRIQGDAKWELQANQQGR